MYKDNKLVLGIIYKLRKMKCKKSNTQREDENSIFLYKVGLVSGQHFLPGLISISQDSKWGTRGNHEGTSDFTYRMAIVITN